MPQPVAEFMRFSAPDPVALARTIAETQVKLAVAVKSHETLAVIEAAADLGSMLTAARREVEAAELLEQYAPSAEAFADNEPTGWFWNAYATALQYCGKRNEAEHYFSKSVALAKAGGWRRLEALTLHHWGRSLAEQQRFSEAECRISEALTIRIELNEPRQESSRRALVELLALQDSHGHQPARGDA